MTIVVAIVVVLAITALIYADYKWRRWMAARRRERGDESNGQR